MSFVPVTCSVSVSPVACHLITTLYSFICFESLKRLGNVAAGSFVIKRVGINKLFLKNPPPFVLVFIFTLKGRTS